MKKNFSIATTVEISFSGCLYDLHNDFDAVRVEHDIADNALTIWWDDRNSVGQTLSIHFSSMRSLQLNGIDEEMPRKEDKRLSFIGYSRPDDKSMSGFLPEELSEVDHHIILCFEGGLTMRVYAESVMAKIEKR
jgi:hypothetical protein